jgi:HK97 family phage portal protein
MGFWSRLKAAFLPGQRETMQFEVSKWANSPPRRGTRELLAAYREQPLLRAIVGKISDNVADLNWRVYKRRAKDGTPQKDFMLRGAVGKTRRDLIKGYVDSGQAVEKPDHPFLQLLEDPCNALTGRAFRRIVQTHMDIVGEAFLAVERVGSTPIGLWPIPPSAVYALPDMYLPPEERFYRVTFGRISARITERDIIHLRDHDPEDPLGRGVGLGFVLGDELDTDEYVARFVKNSFWNNMLPAGVIAIEGMPPGDHPKAKAFKESLASDYQGPEKAGRIMVTGGKTSIARLDTAFKDIQLVELRKFLQNFTRMTYGVPPEIIGDISNSNKATAFAAREILAEQVISPRGEFWRTELQKRLLPMFDENAVLDFDSPVPADREHQLKVMGTFREAFKVNEVRQLAGCQPDPARGDEYLAPAPGSKPGADAGTPSPDPQGADGAADEASKAFDPGI